MRGRVLKRAGADGTGLIVSLDGRRYTFVEAQVRTGGPLAEGATVDFVVLGDEARDIYLIPDAPVAPPPVAAAPARPVATAGAVRADSLPTYFLRAITRNYFQFKGRARRSEYWGFTLFLILTLVALLFIDFGVSYVFFGTDEYGDPNYLPILTALFYLYCIIPGIAITVRRLHDLDQSGWLYLLGFIPYIGGLIVFVFMVIDSNQAPNKHGPSPKYGAAQLAEVFA